MRWVLSVLYLSEFVKVIVEVLFVSFNIITSALHIFLYVYEKGTEKKNLFPDIFI